MAYHYPGVDVFQLKPWQLFALDSNLAAVIAEKRLLTEPILSPDLLYQLVLESTGNEELADDMRVELEDKKMRASNERI